MLVRDRLFAPLALVLITAVIASPRDARALTVVYNNITYDLEIYNGSYEHQTSLFATPANAGRMPWWGNTALADALAGQLADGLTSPPYPAFGPLFATSFDSASPGEEVTASVFDLSSLGGPSAVLSWGYDRAIPQSYVVAATAVPVPLPVAAAVVVLSAERRLRRLSARLRRGRPRR
ncbi:MAG: hypothetical protein ACK6AD_04120 [Cyanobacteriota bacterium]|jgi:hypothetical protein